MAVTGVGATPWPPLDAGGGAPGAFGAQGGGSFADVLRQVFAEANRAELEAARLSEALVTGQVQDVSQVVLAAQKAELSLQLAVQVRTKLLEAFQEIMRMPV